MVPPKLPIFWFWTNVFTKNFYYCDCRLTSLNPLKKCTDNTVTVMDDEIQLQNSFSKFSQIVMVGYFFYYNYSASTHSVFQHDINVVHNVVHTFKQFETILMFQVGGLVVIRMEGN